MALFSASFTSGSPNPVSNSAASLVNPSTESDYLLAFKKRQSIRSVRREHLSVQRPWRVIPSPFLYITHTLKTLSKGLPAAINGYVPPYPNPSVDGCSRLVKYFAFKWPVNVHHLFLFTVVYKMKNKNICSKPLFITTNRHLLFFHHYRENRNNRASQKYFRFCFCKLYGFEAYVIISIKHLLWISCVDEDQGFHLSCVIKHRNQQLIIVDFWTLFQEKSHHP